MNEVFIAGCGYVGWHLIDALPDGTGITALSHSDANSARLQQRGITTVRADLDQAESLEIPTLSGQTLFYFIPPPSSGRQDPRLRRLLTALSDNGLPARIVLISATGVYGDCGGAWVDEQRPAQPNSDRGQRRLHAEQTLLSWAQQHRVTAVILRVAGIYGPGKLPSKRLEQGLPILHQQDAPWSNRIHIADLIQACLAAASADAGLVAGQCYNIADGHPSTMTDYFNQVADLLGLPHPPTVTLEQAGEQLSAGMLSYLAESRRLDNRRLREQLQVRLRYPTLKTGLPSCRPSPTGDP